MSDFAPGGMFYNPTPDFSSQADASVSASTPPTTVSDAASLHSNGSKHDIVTVPVDDFLQIDPALQLNSLIDPLLIAQSEPSEATTAHHDDLPDPTPTPPEPASGRSRRSRGPQPVYNLAKLVGTAGHGKRRVNGDIVNSKSSLRRQSIAAGTHEFTPRAKKQAERQLEQSVVSTSTSTRPAQKAVHVEVTEKPKVVLKAASVEEVHTEIASNTSAQEPAEQPAKETVESSGEQDGEKANDTAVDEGIHALDLQWSPPKLSTPPRVLRRRSAPVKTSPKPQRTSSRRRAAVESVSMVKTRLSSASTAVTKSMSSRAQRSTRRTQSALPRELRQLQDTDEFAGRDDRPVINTYWSNGKFIDPSAPEEPPVKKSKVKETGKEPEHSEEEADEEDVPVTDMKRKRVKKYLDKGLYAGQSIPIDQRKGLTVAEKKEVDAHPELIPRGRTNKIMPPPIFTGLRLLINGRDFKLPYNVCNPLPPGQAKPNEYRKMTKNRFVGESKEMWRKRKVDDSKCVCRPEDGCGDDCLNRTLFYECDSVNCSVGPELCTNRAFADLQARRAKGGKYRVGVEVVKTSDRGFGVRSNRSFRPNQIIMEYTGEIITEQECDRRMRNEYRNNDCYYLMSFDQNMILDATTGSIARFVNHSCEPNCRMDKWIVGGQPRMALFAGDNPIQTGDELTYDYNFDPFSLKNVQACLCGAPNCRGVLGPKPKGEKLREINLSKAVKETVQAGKRKLKELAGNDRPSSPKKQKTTKTAPGEGIKNSLSSKIRTTTAALKRTVSVKSAGSTTPGKSTSKKPVIKRTTKKQVVTKKKPAAAAAASTPAATPISAKRKITPTKKGISFLTKRVVMKRTAPATQAKNATPGKKVTPRGKAALSKKPVAAPKKMTPAKATTKASKADPSKATPKKAIPSKATSKKTTPNKATPKGKQPRKVIGKPNSPRKAIDLKRGKPSIRIVQSSKDPYEDYEH